MKQKWICDDCKIDNEIEIPDHSDVMSVVHIIQENHEMVSPACENSYLNLRVVNEENPTD